MELVLIIATLLLSALFSSSELAFVTANRLKVEASIAQAGYGGKVVADFLHKPAKFLTTTLVGNNLALVAYSMLMAYALEGGLDTFWRETVGMGASAEVVVLISQTLVAAVVVLLLGEIIPKSIVRELADRAVFILAIPLRFTYIILYPFIWIAGRASRILARLFRADQQRLDRFLSRELELLIKQENEALEIDDDEREILSNVFSMPTRSAKACMIPRTAMSAVSHEATLEDVRQMFIETGYSKLPVYEESLDHIVGIIFAHDLFKQPKRLKEITRKPKFVPETKNAKDLLTEFRAGKTTIAIVVNEFGGTAGLITIEDLIEELVGDIEDEFDNSDLVMRQINEHSYMISGQVEISDLEAKFDLALPEGDYETVAGYLLSELGTIPEPNTTYQLLTYAFTIVKARQNRIDLVQITRNRSAALFPETEA